MEPWPTSRSASDSAGFSTSSSPRCAIAGYPPSVREIGEAVGLTSPSTVHSHLNTLTRLGYLRRDPDQATRDRGPLGSQLGCRHGTPPGSPRSAGRRRRGRHRRARPGERRRAVPRAERLHRRRRSVHAASPWRLDDRCRHPRRRLRDRRPAADRQHGDIVVAGIPGDEATVKTFRTDGDRVVLVPANPDMEPLEFPADDVTIYGRVVTVMRRL